MDFPEEFNIAEHLVDGPAREHPARVAIAGEPRAVTYGELAELVNRAGNALRAMGVQRGERVLIVLPDSVEFFAAFFGAAKIGAVAVPVNPFARAADYAHYAGDCQPRVAVIHSEALGEFLSASGQRAQMPIVFAGEESAETGGVRCLRWSEWIAAAGEELEAEHTGPRDSAFFLYTSGSGGKPKAAVHQHKDMLLTSRNYAQGVLGLRADDVIFSVSKLFFAYGMGNGMTFPLAAGARVVLNPARTKVEDILELVRRHRPTVFFAVPSVYAGILAAAEKEEGIADFGSVRLAVSAGESLPAEIFERFRERFGVEILDGIGSTEMLHVFLSSRAGKAVAGSCGTAVPGYEARIVDEDGRAVGAGEIGNLWVRGESAFAEYWGIAELTARAKREAAGDFGGEKWVVTGDKFTCDAGGNYFYCGRADDMLKVAGMWVSPTEVENALLGHPEVAEAAVVAAGDAQGLTYALAYVVLRDAGKASGHLAEEIRGHARARLVSYKTPREIRFVGELPKTATGKIQRYKLRGLAG
ncbi:MAG: benzoate-CoA ligase family protein [Acidobacteriia bacterium]|nr:benzoate-CoA ligase family protein [Terriglobia bacterium]